MTIAPPETPKPSMTKKEQLVAARNLFGWATASIDELNQKYSDMRKELGDLKIRIGKATSTAELTEIQTDFNALKPEYDQVKKWRNFAKYILRDYPAVIDRLEGEVLDDGPHEQDQNQKQSFENLIEAPSLTTGPAVPDVGDAKFSLANNGLIQQERPLGKLPGIGSIENRFNNIAAVEPVAVAPVQAVVSPLQSGSLNAQGLPPLVRLDGQPLKPEENMYPAMAYRENEHQAWPQEAIDLATKKYPDLPKQIEASRTLVPDHPDDLLDPDYFPLPENPTLKDQLYHGIWKEKKQGIL